MSTSPFAPLLIGVSARIYHPEGPVLDLGGVWTKTLHYLEQSVAHWVMHGGAMAVMIPAVDSDSVVTREDLNLSHYAAALDGLVLQGGNDVAPQTYGDLPLHPHWAGDRVRDRYEIELVKAFVDAGKPGVRHLPRAAAAQRGFRRHAVAGPAHAAPGRPPPRHRQVRAPVPRGSAHARHAPGGAVPGHGKGSGQQHPPPGHPRSGARLHTPRRTAPTTA